jgi:hypothetical protein
MVEAEALLLSMAIEGPIAFSIVRFTRWPCRGALHVGLASAVATAVTLPQLWSAAIWAYPRFPYWPSIVILEALVMSAEGLLIAWMAGLALPRAMFLSLIANVASCLAGLLIAG